MQRILITFTLVIIFLLHLCVNSSALSFTGKVVKVSDGDTIQVLRVGKAVRIRLAEIDCPEKDQPFGKAAKRFTLDLVAQKIVTVSVETTDRYGRIVGELILPDGTSLNRQLVVAGYAWQYKQYSKSSDLAKFEAAARIAKRGLWSDPEPVPPWDWRRGKRSANQKSVVAGGYHGNTDSHVFHKPGCRYYDCKNCGANFGARDAAIKAGYRPCRVCKP